MQNCRWPFAKLSEAFCKIVGGEKSSSLTALSWQARYWSKDLAASDVAPDVSPSALLDVMSVSVSCCSGNLEQIWICESPEAQIWRGVGSCWLWLSACPPRTCALSESSSLSQRCLPQRPFYKQVILLKVITGRKTLQSIPLTVSILSPPQPKRPLLARCKEI